MDVTDDPRLNRDDAEIVRMKVRKFIRRFSFLQSEAEDLEQEVSLHVALRMHRHRAGRGCRAAFVNKVAGNLLLNHVEKATALKRDRRLEVQIDQVGVSLLGVETQFQAALGRRIDVRCAIAVLPAELRRVATLLQVYSAAEVVRITGLTRAEVRSRMAQIGRHFQQRNIFL